MHKQSIRYEYASDYATDLGVIRYNHSHWCLLWEMQQYRVMSAMRRLPPVCAADVERTGGLEGGCRLSAPVSRSGQESQGEAD